MSRRAEIVIGFDRCSVYLPAVVSAAELGECRDIGRTTTCRQLASQRPHQARWFRAETAIATIASALDVSVRFA